MVVLIFVVVLFAVVLLLGQIVSSLPGLIANGVVGLILIFLTNLFLTDDLPINFLTIAISGVVGWLIILLLHLLGIAF